MNIRIRHTATIFATLLGSYAMTSTASAQSFVVDPVHSLAMFRVNHFDTANFYGRFNRMEGAVVVEADEVKSLDIRVDAESVDTNNKDRDAHLRGPDFFDTKQFPDITFKSKSVKKTADKTFEVVGELTLRGATKPVTVTLIKIGEGKNVQQQDIIGYETTFKIIRSEYGVTGYVGKGLGDEVTLTVSIEAIKQ